MVSENMVSLAINGPIVPHPKARVKKAKEALNLVYQELQLFEEHKESLQEIAERTAEDTVEYKVNRKLQAITTRKRRLELWKNQLIEFINENTCETFEDFLTVARMKGYNG